MTIKFPVKLPSHWLKHSFVGYIIVHIEVYCTIYDDSFDVKIRNMLFPGWHAFNIRQEAQDAFHDLIEEMAINEYAKRVEFYEDGNHD